MGVAVNIGAVMIELTGTPVNTTVSSIYRTQKEKYQRATHHLLLMWPVLSTPIEFRFDAYWPIAASIAYSSSVELAAEDVFNGVSHFPGSLGLVNAVMTTIIMTAK